MHLIRDVRAPSFFNSTFLTTRLFPFQESRRRRLALDRDALGPRRELNLVNDTVISRWAMHVVLSPYSLLNINRIFHN